MIRALALAALVLAGVACANQPSTRPAEGAAMSTTMSMSMSDAEAIRTAVTGVVHFLDRRQWGPLRAQFADTVQTDYTSLFGGQVQEQPADALVDAWRGMLSPIVTQHILGPITVAASGATATAECHVRGYHHAKGTPGGDEWMVAGHYVFALEPGPASTWRIRRMKLETLYQTGNLELLQKAAR